MDAPSPPWEPPSAAGPPSAELVFAASAPLGGAAPEAAPVEVRSDARELALVALLLVLSLVAGGASLMSWRDYGVALDPSVPESGWVQADGSLGRGGLAVLLAGVVAVGGILLAVHRARWGRRLAVAGGTGLVLLSVLEFGLGAGRLRTGPGNGLWVELVVGVLVLVAVGALLPPPAIDDGHA